MKTVFVIAAVFAMMIGGSVAVAQATPTAPTQESGTYARNASYDDSTSTSGAIISPPGDLAMEGSSNTDVGSNAVSSSSATNVGSSPSAPVETSGDTFGDYFTFASAIFLIGLLLYAGVVSDYERDRALINPPNKP